MNEREQEALSGFVQILPEQKICCCDLWPPGTLTDGKMAAYRRMIHERKIILRRVTVFQNSGHITVEYRSDIPHAWILEELAKEMKREKEHGKYSETVP